jgi:leucyl-tRNA synthetase
LSNEAQMAMPEKLGGSLANARREIHATLKQANYDLARQQFNTVASAAMKMLNALEKLQKDNEAGWQSVAQEGFSILLRLLSPIAPHITQALWKDLGYGDDILAAVWPEPLEAALVQDEIELVVQVNGKLRGSITVARTLEKAAIEQHAVAQPFVQKFIEEGATVRKIIVVPNKLVNIVVG